MNAHSPRSRKVIISIFIGLGIWLFILFWALSWFQNSYVRGFTEHHPKFLQAQYSEHWFKQLIHHLPNKQADARLIQFWQPDCLCNRFARPHAINAMGLTQQLNYEHITLIPNSYQSQLKSLQSLNPNTQVIAIDPSILPIWPASPSVLIEDSKDQLMYFGPLGFGSFCNEASTNIIEAQLKGIANGTSRPFYNQVGKGCFCQWHDSK